MGLCVSKNILNTRRSKHPIFRSGPLSRELATEPEKPTTDNTRILCASQACMSQGNAPGRVCRSCRSKHVVTPLQTVTSSGPPEPNPSQAESSPLYSGKAAKPLSIHDKLAVLAPCRGEPGSMHQLTPGSWYQLIIMVTHGGSP